MYIPGVREQNDPDAVTAVYDAQLPLAQRAWLFTVNAGGVIAARLNGAFGVNEASAALDAALGFG